MSDWNPATFWTLIATEVTVSEYESEFPSAPQCTAEVRSERTGEVLLAAQNFPCVYFLDHVLEKLGSRPSRPVTLLHNGTIEFQGGTIGPELRAEGDTHYCLTATFRIAID